MLVGRIVSEFIIPNRKFLIILGCFLLYVMVNIFLLDIFLLHNHHCMWVLTRRQNDGITWFAGSKMEGLTHGTAYFVYDLKVFIFGVEELFL